MIVAAFGVVINDDYGNFQRIRGFLKCYALYKSTFYLLTYLLIRIMIKISIVTYETK